MINLYNILVVKASLNYLWKYSEFVFLQEFVQLCLMIYITYFRSCVTFGNTKVLNSDFVKVLNNWSYMNDEYLYIDRIYSYSQSYVIYFFLKSVALVTSHQCLKIHYHMMSIYCHGQTTSFVLPTEEKLIPRTRKDMPPLSFHVEGISRKPST
jgi:hypothetical protein